MKPTNHRGSVGTRRVASFHGVKPGVSGCQVVCDVITRQATPIQPVAPRPVEPFQRSNERPSRRRRQTAGQLPVAKFTQEKTFSLPSLFYFHCCDGGIRLASLYLLQSPSSSLVDTDLMRNVSWAQEPGKTRTLIPHTPVGGTSPTPGNPSCSFSHCHL